MLVGACVACMREDNKYELSMRVCANYAIEMHT